MKQTGRNAARLSIDDSIQLLSRGTSLAIST